MADQATVTVTVDINVSPDGITLGIEALDKDLASLIVAAGEFEVLPSEYHTFDTSTVTLKSKKMLSFVDRPVTTTTP